MSQTLTLEHFDEVMGAIKQSFNSLESKMATKTELATLRAEIKFDTQDIVHNATQMLLSDFSDLQTSVDSYAKCTQDWHQEQFILRNRVDRLEKTLVRKNIIGDEDLTAV